MGLLEAAAEYIPEAQWQRCTVHFYRNVFGVVPRKHVRTVADMLKAIHACEDRQAAQDKARAVIGKLKLMRLKAAAAKVEEAIAETLTFYGFPLKHLCRIRTNDPLESIMRKIRRRTRVVGAIPAGSSFGSACRFSCSAVNGPGFCMIDMKWSIESCYRLNPVSGFSRALQNTK